MRSLILAIRRAMAMYQVRSLEITLEGQTVALATIRDRDTWSQVFMARIQTRRALAKARARYNSLLPPGQRMTYEVA